MPQSFAQIYLHIVFSTKHRQPFLQHKPLREEMHAYLGGICRDLGSPSLIVGGVADHLHLLCRFGRMLAVSVFLRELKRESSKWVKTKDPELAQFHWQDGYGAFSLSPGHVGILTSYIARQEDHHSTESFQDEYRRLLEKYGIEYDERYVWD
jgi:REP element-mobilizing transposase RayT